MHAATRCKYVLQVLYTDDLCAGEQVFFAATGVSDGDLLRGVRYFAGGASSNSIVMRSGSGTGLFPFCTVLYMTWTNGHGFSLLSTIPICGKHQNAKQSPW